MVEIPDVLHILHIEKGGNDWREEWKMFNEIIDWFSKVATLNISVMHDRIVTSSSPMVADRQTYYLQSISSVHVFKGVGPIYVRLTCSVILLWICIQRFELQSIEKFQFSRWFSQCEHKYLSIDEFQFFIFRDIVSQKCATKTS